MCGLVVEIRSIDLHRPAKKSVICRPVQTAKNVLTVPFHREQIYFPSSPVVKNRLREGRKIH